MSTPAMNILNDFYLRLNAGDIEGAMRLVADDAVFANPSGTFAGASQIRAFLQRVADTGHAFELNDISEIDGRLQMAYRIYREGRLIDEGPDGVTVVRDGQIVFDGTKRMEIGKH